jgi:hypothetical protein
MEPHGSLLHSKEFTNCPFSELDQSGRSPPERGKTDIHDKQVAHGLEVSSYPWSPRITVTHIHFVVCIDEGGLCVIHGVLNVGGINRM